MSNLRQKYWGAFIAITLVLALAASACSDTPVTETEEIVKTEAAAPEETEILEAKTPEAESQQSTNEDAVTFIASGDEAYAAADFPKAIDAYSQAIATAPTFLDVKIQNLKGVELEVLDLP